MANDNAAKLYKILDMLEKAGKDQKEISKIRKLIDYGKIEQALNKIRELNSSSGTKTETKQAKSQAKKHSNNNFNTKLYIKELASTPLITKM